MLTLYVCLVAVHLVAIVVTGILWTIIDCVPRSTLRPHLRDIRAVHFGSLYLVPILLGLAWAFDRLQVPGWCQLPFPMGLGALVLFAGIGYVFPRAPGLDPFYYWTRGRAFVLAVVGLVCLAAAILWTAGVLVLYAVAR